MWKSGLAAVTAVPVAPLGPLHARLAGRESGLYQEELVEDETVHGRPQACPLRGEVNLVDGIV